MPNLYIIAGCNGAGKTTASFSVLPDLLNCREFVNADEIARGLSPFEPETVSVEAGRIMLERIQELIRQKKDFAFETTLSGKAYVRLIQQAREQNYSITLLFLWLNSVEMALERVKIRVTEGGHNIPAQVISRRYHSGIVNFFELYLPISDYWIVLDNSENTFLTVAEGSGNGDRSIKEELTWDTIYEQYKRIR